MELYFLRHGEADWPNWNKPDDERPLTKRGKKEMHEVGKFLKRVEQQRAVGVRVIKPPHALGFLDPDLPKRVQHEPEAEPAKAIS